MRQLRRRVLHRVGRGLIVLLGACGACSGLAAATDAPFLWQVQGAQATHYLLGSVHLLPASAHPLPVTLDAAYDATAALVLESDLAALSAPQAQAQMLDAGLAPDGLRSGIGAALYLRVQAQARQRDLPETLCDRFKAWLCALTLGLAEFDRAGLEPRYGIDQHFFGRALRDGRSVDGLESAAVQLQLFAGMPPDLSEQFLTATLDDLDRPEAGPQALLQMWRDNDRAGMERLSQSNRERYPAMHAILLADRNRAWLAPLMALLDGATAQLIVVGAAHLLGPDGLVALLHERGVGVQAVSDAPEPELQLKLDPQLEWIDPAPPPP